MRARTNRVPARLLILAGIVGMLGLAPAHASLIFDSGCATLSAGANKDSATDLTLAPSNSCSGDANFADDWYVFNFAAPASLGIVFSVGGDRVQVIDPQNRVVAPTAPGATPAWHLRAAAGKWFIKIAAVNNFVGGDYHFTYDHRQQDDCTNGLGTADAGNTKGTAHEISTTPSTCVARVWSSPNSTTTPPVVDPADWYKINLNQGQSLSVDWAASGDYTDGCGNTVGSFGFGAIACDSFGGITVEIYGPTGNVPVAQGAGASSSASTSHTASQAGVHYVRVVGGAVAAPAGAGSGDALYTIVFGGGLVPNVGNIGVNTGDCATFNDAGNNRASASPIGLFGFPHNACTGTLTEGTDNDDWFSFNGNAGDTVSFTASTDGVLLTSIELRLVNPSGGVAQGPFGAGLFPGTNVSFVLPSAGTWYLHVKRGAGSGSYVLTFDVVQVAVPSIGPSVIPSVPNISLGEGDNCAAGADAGNTSSTAYRVYPSDFVPVACYGQIGGQVGNAPDGHDWYSFQATSGQRATFAVSSYTDVNTYLVRPNGTTALPSEQFGQVPEYGTYTLDATGLWRIRVSPRSSSDSGYYVLTLDLRNDPANVGTLPSIPGVPSVGVPSVGVPNVLGGDDCGATGDASTSGRTPRAIGQTTTCWGSLGGQDSFGAKDTMDWYQFSGVRGTELVVAVPGDGYLDPIVTLWSPNMVKTAEFPQTGPTPEYFRVTLPQTGTWKLQIKMALGSAQGRYGLFLEHANGAPGGVHGVPNTGTTVPSITGDCGQPGDAGGTFATARGIQGNTACAGNLSAGDTRDFYKFTAVEGQRITISQGSNANLDADLFLYNKAGRLRAMSNFAGLTPSAIMYFATSDGTWYLEVRRSSGSGDYSLSVSVTSN